MANITSQSDMGYAFTDRVGIAAPHAPTIYTFNVCESAVSPLSDALARLGISPQTSSTQSQLSFDEPSIGTSLRQRLRK